MSQGPRKQLQSRRRAEIQSATAKLLEDENCDVSDRIGRIENLDKLIAAMPPRRSPKRLVGTIIGAIVVTIAGLAWSLKVPVTKVVLAVEADSVEMRLAGDWSWSENLVLSTNGLTAERMTRLELPPVASAKGGNLPSRLEGEPWLSAADGRITLSKLSLGEGGRLIIERRDDDLVRLFARGAAFDGELFLSNDARLSAAGDNAATAPEFSARFDHPVPETLVFHADGGSAVPAHLRFSPDEDFVLYDLPVHDLTFMREEVLSSGHPVFVSAVTGGTIDLADTSKTVKLRQRERLVLNSARGRISQIRIGEHIEVAFEGSVSAVKVGPKGFERDLTPSVLEFVYRNEPLWLFWSALLFLWGMLWNVRDFFTR